MKHKSLNQMLCAAVVNKRFRDTLLQNPQKAISRGYLDHNFSLSANERALVENINARELEDFARQVHQSIS